MADKKMPPWLKNKKGGDEDEENEDAKPGDKKKKMSPADRLKAFKKMRDSKKKK